jgi:hypothetical protein
MDTSARPQNQLLADSSAYLHMLFTESFLAVVAAAQVPHCAAQCLQHSSTPRARHALGTDASAHKQQTILVIWPCCVHERLKCGIASIDPAAGSDLGSTAVQLQSCGAPGATLCCTFNQTQD